MPAIWTLEQDNIGVGAQINMFAEHNGKLWAATTDGGTNSAAMWSSSDGSSWSLHTDMNSQSEFTNWGTTNSVDSVDVTFVHDGDLYAIGTDVCRLIKYNVGMDKWEQVGGTQSRLNGNSTNPAFPRHVLATTISGTPTVFLACQRQTGSEAPVYEATGNLESWSNPFTTSGSGITGQAIWEMSNGDILCAATDEKVYKRDAGSGTWDSGTQLNNASNIDDVVVFGGSTAYLVARTTTPASDHMRFYKYTTSGGWDDVNGFTVDTDASSTARTIFNIGPTLYAGPGDAGADRVWHVSTDGVDWDTTENFNHDTNDEPPKSRSHISSAISGSDKVYVGTSGGGQIWSTEDVPICWNYTAKYNKGTKVFKLSGPGPFPKRLSVPENVDKQTGAMVDDGVLIDPDEYEVN